MRWLLNGTGEGTLIGLLHVTPKTHLQLRLEKVKAFQSGDKDWFKETKYRFSKVVRDAKLSYSTTWTSSTADVCVCVSLRHARIHLISTK